MCILNANAEKRYIGSLCTLIARFIGPTWGSSGADRTRVGHMWATWTLLSGYWCSLDRNILYFICLADQSLIFLFRCGTDRTLTKLLPPVPVIYHYVIYAETAFLCSLFFHSIGLFLYFNWKDYLLSHQLNSIEEHVVRCGKRFGSSMSCCVLTSTNTL